MSIIKKIYNSEYTIIASMILGIIFGITFKEIAHSYAELGKIYLNLLQVSVIPLVVFTIIICVFHVYESPKHIVSKSAIYGFGLIVISLAIAVGIALLIKPWTYITDLSDFNSLFSDAITEKPIEKLATDSYGGQSNPGVLQFITKTIPTNIFNALNYNNMLQIIFGAGIIGFGFYKVAEKSTTAKNVKEKFSFGLEVFTTINNKIISFMPIGVFFLMANQFSYVDFKALHAVIMLTVTIICALVAVIFLYVMIIWVKSGTSFFNFLNAFSSTFLILITTMSSIVALPKSMESLRKLKFSEAAIDMVMPIGVSLIRVGTMIFFSIATLFIMGLFDVPITLEKCVFLSLASIFAAMSTGGATGVVAMQMISIILEPLGLPLGGTVAILIAIDVIVDIFDTFANLIGNAAIVALASEKEQ